MDKIERERIEKDAIAFSHRSMSDAMFVEVLSPKGCYIAGATAEHDKARNQGIQDCIDVVSATPGDENVIPKLESLRTKQITSN